jgi:hypothetical protein
MAPLKYVLGAVLALALGFALGGGLFFSKQRRAASPAGAESARTPMEQRPPMRRAPGAPQLSTEPLSAAPSAAPVPVVELPAPAPTAALLPARKADARVMRKPAAPAPSSSVSPLWVEVTPQTASRSTTAIPRQKPTVDIETPLFER